jgi:formate-dependent phosphoribosylglycinamide formyltransferase (GAR transformylase)
MRDRFINGTIPVSFSPRRELQFAKKTSFLMAVAKYDFAKATRVALQAVVIASADKDAVDSILSLAQVAFGIDNTKAYKNVF